MEFVTAERIAEVFATMTTTIAQRPTRATASFGGAAGSGALQDVTTGDAASVMFRTASGVLGTVVVSQVSAGRKHRLWFEFDGEYRSAVFTRKTRRRTGLAAKLLTRCSTETQPTAPRTPDACRASQLVTRRAKHSASKRSSRTRMPPYSVRRRRGCPPSLTGCSPCRSSTLWSSPPGQADGCLSRNWRQRSGEWKNRRRQ